MMSASNKEILVYADWQALNGPHLMGRLFVTRARGKEVFQFEYDPSWLQNEWVLQLDPELHRYTGRQFPASEKNNFGVFLDSMPDRWGRQLMLRRESMVARREGRTPQQLFDSDFLLGVYDQQRPGALRFKFAGGTTFLNDDKTLAIPPWSSLRELEYACHLVERQEDDASVSLQWLDMLMAPGSSLGGARPKAGVTDAAGNLWIAKFPSKNDDYDVGAWEMIVNDLARKAGLTVAEGQKTKLRSRHHTFLSKRFDRTASGERLHFASAMTMLQRSDGDDFSTGASYLEMADFIIRNGSNPDADLEELWRRIVFSILVKNTDDHLRNHGFILNRDGWSLSPAYDMNPNPKGRGLSLNVSENDNSLDLELALSVAKHFRLNDSNAAEIIRKARTAVALWKSTAKSHKLSEFETDLMAPAFLPDSTRRRT